MTIISKVGIETEVLLVNKKGCIDLPHHTMGRDDFGLLGEIRAEPGTTPEETYANYVKAHLEYTKLAAEHDLSITTLFEGGMEIEPDLYEKAMRISTFKKFPIFNSIKYKKVPRMSNQLSNGNYWASTGLHVHFSCLDTVEWYQPIKVYEDGRKITKDTKMCHNTYLLSWNDMVVGINHMDRYYLNNFGNIRKTQYRLPGMYEIKSYGFEYRSIGFDGVMDKVYRTCQEAFIAMDKMVRRLQ